MERFQWTDERTAMLEKLWDQGHTAQVIADHFGGITRNAVLGKVHRLGLKDHGGIRRQEGCRKGGRTSFRKMTGQLPKPRKPEPAPTPKPLPVVIEQKSNPPLKGIPDLGPKDCRFPIGDPRDPGFGFCGKPVEYGRVYCGEHCRQAYPNHKPMIDLARAA